MTKARPPLSNYEFTRVAYICECLVISGKYWYKIFSMDYMVALRNPEHLSENYFNVIKTLESGFQEINPHSLEEMKDVLSYISLFSSGAAREASAILKGALNR